MPEFGNKYRVVSTMERTQSVNSIMGGGKQNHNYSMNLF